MKAADYALGCDCIGLSTDDIAQEANATAETAKKVGAKVSPWLWVFSVAGLILAGWNKYQINHMFGSYKNMRATLWRR